MSYARNGYSQSARRARQTELGFTCRNCAMYVPCAPDLAGVQNRNHCPYCLWSRHLDWRTPGDRLCGCRAKMRPIGLTTKRSRNKYARERDGELMIIHRCTVCAAIVLNRIAADDSPAMLLELFDASCAPGALPLAELTRSGVTPLGPADAELLRRGLFGRGHDGPLGAG